MLAAATLLVAACAPQGESYYPLETGRSWTYAMSIQPASGEMVTASSEVTNLPERRVAGQTVTPQATEALGQRRLRFISADGRGVVEIADQDANEPEPQVKRPPNTILKMPLTVGRCDTACRFSPPDQLAAAAVAEYQIRAFSVYGILAGRAKWN